MYFTSLIYLLIYVLLWFCLFVVRQKKVKYFGAGSFIVLLYTIIGIISCFEYNTIYYKELQLFPFIYLFVAVIIASLPVLKYNEASVTEIQLPSKAIINTFSYIYIIATIMVLPKIIGELHFGITTLFMDDSGGKELYEEAHNFVISNARNFGPTNIFMTIFNIFSDFVILVFFYYLAFNHNKPIIIFLAFSIFVHTIRSISLGGRTDITMSTLAIVVGYTTMRKFIPEKIRNIFIRIGIIAGGFIVILLISMTISRFSSSTMYDDNPFRSFIGYTGQCNLNFNENALDVGGTRNGDRTANTFKHLFGFDNVPASSTPTRLKYPYLKMNDSVFYTFVGDFVLDYGPISTIVIFCFFSFLACYLTTIKKGRLYFHQLIILYFVMCVCTHGSFYLFYYSFGQNFVIIAFLLMFLIFKFDSTYYSKNNVWQL